MRDIVFIHIPKTAGTSLRTSLIKAFPEKQVLYDYGAEASLTSQQIRRIRYSGKDEPERLREEVGSAPLLLVGHFPAHVYLKLFAYENFITFIREPMARIVSEYKHFVRHYDYEGKLLEFASFPPGRKDMQTKFLEGLDLDHMGFIGISEDYETSIVNLSNFLGRTIENAQSNAAPRNQIIRLSTEEKKELERMNHKDLTLYKSITRGECIRRIRHASVAVRGSAQRVDKNLVRGWAVPSDEKRIAKISLEIDGKLVRCNDIICDIYRADLVRAGINTTGLGGFELDLSECQLRENPKIRLFSAKWEIII